MVDKNLSPYIRCIMNYFSCNQKMAETIIEASKENGEFESIKNMCLLNQNERSVQS